MIDFIEFILDLLLHPWPTILNICNYNFFIVLFLDL